MDIILLNGPSSAGKSSITRRLKAALDSKRQCSVIALDDYLVMKPDEPIYGDDIRALTPRMCSDIRALLTAGDLVIIDHVITDPQIYEAVLNACEGYTILRVLVECDLETLRRRELERGDRCPGSAEESLKYLYPKTGYDVTVDSGRMTTEEIINVILG